MPTTSNFGWTTPADTDLVKDGAAAIRTLGNGIDTSFLDLKGGTTDQVLAKNSNTDLDFKWVAQDDSNAIQNALLTTTGDTIYASAASTPARLGVGSTGQVLTVSGGVPTWATPVAGGFTQLATGSLSGSSLSLTSISGSYKDLVLRLVNYYGSADADITVTVNNTTGIYYLTSSPDTFNVNLNATNFNITRNGQDGSDGDNFVDLKIFDYANTTSNKIMESTYVFLNSGGGASNYNLGQAWIAAKLTSAINRIDLTLSTGTFSSGTYVLYGVS